MCGCGTSGRSLGRGVSIDVAVTWLRLEARRRWGSLLVLALLVALAAGTVLTAIAGARRGQTAYDRLWARTLPATVGVLANQPDFDWSKVEALPEVSATGLFAVYTGAAVYPASQAGSGAAGLEFPPANASLTNTVERPVLLQGRRANPARADEVMATPHYMSANHLRVGDELTVHLSSPAQAAAGFDASTGRPLGPRLTVHIVGVVRSPFFMDQPGDGGGVVSTYGFFKRYRRGPAAPVERATAASPLVAGYLDVRVGGAQAKGVSIESFTYTSVDGKRVPVVLTAGGMPHSPDQITLAPTTARELGAGVGSALRLTGGPHMRTMTVSGIGFVPAGPHNNYDQGAWLTPAGFDRLFLGAHFAFKFHAALVALKPGVATGTGARTLTTTAAAIKGGAAFPFTPAQGGPVQQLKDLEVLPTALGGFLALLAAGAVSYALTTTVRRRAHELGVLRALGMTTRQARLVIITQATALAVVGLAAGIPLGLLAGRVIWREVANFTPLAYHPPFSPWALALVAPAALVAANALALSPGWRAARLRPAHILRKE